MLPSPSRPGSPPGYPRWPWRHLRGPVPHPSRVHLPRPVPHPSRLLRQSRRARRPGPRATSRRRNRSGPGRGPSYGPPGPPPCPWPHRSSSGGKHHRNRGERWPRQIPLASSRLQGRWMNRRHSRRRLQRQSNRPIPAQARGRYRVEVEISWYAWASVSSVNNRTCVNNEQQERKARESAGHGGFRKTIWRKVGDGRRPRGMARGMEDGLHASTDLVHHQTNSDPSTPRRPSALLRKTLHQPWRSPTHLDKRACLPPPMLHSHRGSSVSCSLACPTGRPRAPSSPWPASRVTRSPDARGWEARPDPAELAEGHRAEGPGQLDAQLGGGRDEVVAAESPIVSQPPLSRRIRQLVRPLSPTFA